MFNFIQVIYIHIYFLDKQLRMKSIKGTSIKYSSLTRDIIYFSLILLIYYHKKFVSSLYKNSFRSSGSLYKNKLTDGI